MNQPTGSLKGDFIAPPEIEDQDERAAALPEQDAFWHPPVRFGSVPVEKEPLGWDWRQGFRKLFPRVRLGLPFQVVDRIPFGHPELEPNRLFWGDNLHVMRQLPSESIDLIYIDPPFFSGRQYTSSSATRTNYVPFPISGKAECPAISSGLTSDSMR